MSTALRACIALLLLSSASWLQADTVTVNFAGTIDVVDSALSSRFTPGQSITGSFTYDSATTARAGSTATQGVFDALDSLEFTSGTYSASSLGAPEIQLDNNLPGFDDRFALVSRRSDGLSGPNVPTIFGRTLTAFVIRLDDSTDTALSTALSLPTSVNRDDFTSGTFFIDFSVLGTGFLTQSVSGRITDLQTDSPVPEPASLIVWGLAMVGGGAYAARRRRKSLPVTNDV